MVYLDALPGAVHLFFKYADPDGNPDSAAARNVTSLANRVENAGVAGQQVEMEIWPIAPGNDADCSVGIQSGGLGVR